MIHDTATRAWLRNLNRVQREGIEVSPAGKLTKEVLCESVAFSMAHPVVNVAARKLSARYLYGEAWWILSGRNDVESLIRYNSRMDAFSDDGKTFFGAYGPMFAEQREYVADSLARDLTSRRSLFSIWRPNPPITKDYPCTCFVQWLVRDGFIHCIDHMRSSDLWLGWPYDVFSFTMATAWIALRYLTLTGERLGLGNLYLTASSSHLYEPQWEIAKGITGNFVYSRQFEGDDSFSIDEFRKPDHLIDFLHLRAEGARSGCSTLGGVICQKIA